MKATHFTVDCTPPVGCSISFGHKGATTGVRDPLMLRGIILEDEGMRFVIAALDFGGLMNSAYDAMTTSLAEACKVPRENVAIHCVHQHDAPLVNFEIEDKVDELIRYPRTWWNNMLDSCTRAARLSLEDMQDVASLGYAESRIFGFASNRRILGQNGKVRGMRFSRCSEESLRNEPVGVIDPILRTIALRDASDRVMATMSFYATHPQVANGRHMYSADAPGEALRLVANRCEGFHAFFTGAGGNVTAGKYSSPVDLEENLLRFGKILADGITRNLASMPWESPTPLSVQSASFPFPRVDTIPPIDPGNDDIPVGQAVRLAVLKSCLEYRSNADYAFSCLKTGRARIMFMPGEPYVEYQLHAQSIVPDQFVAVAANCSDNFLYLPISESFDQGGYEVNSFCWCTGEVEPLLKQAIAAVIRE